MRFVLIHGGYHGAWCWDKLTPELEKLGHFGSSHRLARVQPAPDRDSIAGLVAKCPA